MIRYRTREEAVAAGPIVAAMWDATVGAKPAATAAPAKGPNKLEAAWGRELAMLQMTGRILWYEYEPLRLPLAGRCSYRPDYGVALPGYRRAWCEVKGPHAWEDSIVKLKVAARTWPDVPFWLVRKVNKRWDVRRVCPERGIGREDRAGDWWEG